MAPVDLNKNREAILKAHKEVSDPNNATNWALFGYEGQTDVLKVMSQGDGGISEFIDDLNTGRIMYGYLRVIDPNTNLPKFVFVNWQGEGVPELRKGSCAHHLRDVTNLLRGAHVTIMARNEDDVDEEVVKSKVAKASGANYGFHKEAKVAIPEAGPVGSVYQKTKPQIEIKPNIREKFWEDTAKEEKSRQAAELQRRQADKTKLDKESKDRELQDAKNREERESERVKRAREIKAAEQKANAVNTKQDQAKWEREQENTRRDEEERGKRSDQMRKERAAEAQAMISNRTADKKAVFEQKAPSQFDNPRQAAPPPTRKLKNAFEPQGVPQNEPERKQPIKLPKAATPPPEEIYDDANSAANAPEDIYDDTTAVTKPVSSPGMPSHNPLSQGMPKRQASDDEQEEDQEWAEEPSHPKEELYEDTANMGYGDHAAAAGPEETYEDTAAYSHHPEEPSSELYEDTAAYNAPAHETEELYDQASSGGGGGTGITAKALYDYQAAEENEITFDPDEIIYNIEMIDDGWWLGETKDGNRGMFPANYVELINA